MMSTLEGAGFAACTAYLGWTAVRTALTLRGAAEIVERTRVCPELNGEASMPLVTCLQPILGGDPALERVLRETLQLGPTWCLYLWLVDSDDPAGLEVTRRLAAEDPRVKLVVVPPPEPDLNPKSVKLAVGLEHVTTPFAAVLDDDTIAGEAHFTAALDALGAFDAPATAELYTGLPSYDTAPVEEIGLGGALLAAFVNDGAAAVYLGLQPRRAPRSLNGMFYVARSEDLHRWRAFQSIRQFLCDDLALARHVRAQAGRVLQGAVALRLHTSLADWGAYVRQMHRWHLFARVLLRSEPLRIRGPLVAALAFPPLLLWIALVALIHQRTVALAASVALVLAVRQGALRLIRSRILAERPGPPVAGPGWISLLAELIQPVHALHAALVPTVRWRTRRVRVKADGRFSSVPGGSRS